MDDDSEYHSNAGRRSAVECSPTGTRPDGDEITEGPAAPPQEPASGRVLVVDDVEQNRNVIRRMLALARYSVEEAADGRAAVAAVSAGICDLVLIDIQMPGMDGITATRVIRILDNPANRIPIVAVNAESRPEDITALKTAGLTDYLNKPFRRSELLAKVRAWIGRDHPVGSTARSAAPSTPSPVFDRQAFDDLRLLMGMEWVVQRLSELDDKLAEVFHGGDLDDIDCKQLARQSHLLVSRSSMLGFAEISRLCSDLEAACKAGEPIARCLANVRTAALRVQKVASQLGGSVDQGA